ncbi:MAG: hypothetical protein AAF288_05015 [Planctomycetota bacterium]
MPVILRGLTGATAAAGDTRDRALARTLAESVLADAVAERTWESGDAEGAFDAERFGAPAERFTWNLIAEDWTAPGVKQLTATVSWTRSGRPRALAIATVVAEDEF